ncbi:hypothetical protein HK104_011064 [Borealophlyctis nickersoniae]|nr:hypothetical protein HK104_011064 [Borealophlyctis nickersoniae]
MVVGVHVLREEDTLLVLMLMLSRKEKGETAEYSDRGRDGDAVMDEWRGNTGDETEGEEEEGENRRARNRRKIAGAEDRGLERA